MYLWLSLTSWKLFWSQFSVWTWPATQTERVVTKLYSDLSLLSQLMKANVLSLCNHIYQTHMKVASIFQSKKENNCISQNYSFNIPFYFCLCDLMKLNTKKKCENQCGNDKGKHCWWNIPHPTQCCFLHSQHLTHHNIRCKKDWWRVRGQGSGLGRTCDGYPHHSHSHFKPSVGTLPLLFVCLSAGSKQWGAHQSASVWLQPGSLGLPVPYP